MARMLRIPGPRGRHLYITAGRIMAPGAGGPRYRVTNGHGVTLRLLRLGGRFAILTQSFRVWKEAAR